MHVTANPALLIGIEKVHPPFLLKYENETQTSTLCII
jgi:hypothetical protein